MRATIKELKECHASAGYTVIQFRVWAEMFGGVHPSLDEAAKYTMFLRAGGGAAPKKRDSHSDAVS